MTPCAYTKKDNDVVIYHYKYSELKEFVRNGVENGTSGLLLVKREGNFFHYKGYGTYENPRKTTITIIMKHFEPMDGPMRTDDERLIPPKPLFSEENCRLIFIDLSNKDDEETMPPIIKKHFGTNKERS